MTRVVIIDFETVSACDLKTAGAWRYAEDPTTAVLCASFRRRWCDKTETWAPGEDTTLLASQAGDLDTVFVAHNAAFEKAIWRNIMQPVYGFPPIPNNRWHDTQATCAMRAIPQGLDDAARVLNMGHQKDKTASAMTIGLSKPNRKGAYPSLTARTLTTVYRYCEADVQAEAELLDRIGFLPPGERDVWLLDQRINERGVRIDLDFVRQAQKIVDDASVPLLARFRELTCGLNPTQRDKVIEWCEAEGFRPPNMTKDTLARLLGDPEADEDADVFLGAPPDLPPKVHEALSIRQLIGSASIKKLARMQTCTCADGRARGLLQYHGAGTGRWAGRLLQPQNFPRGTIKIDKAAPDPQLVVAAIMTGDWRYVETILGPAIETVAGALRHALVAGPERKLVVGDFAGIEARVVLALAGQHDKCALMASGADVYLSMAEMIYSAPAGSFNKKTHAAERQAGKNSVLGCGFQMGWATFQRRYCPDQPDSFAKDAVTAYRQSWAPEVPKLWAALESAARETVWTQRPHEAYGVEYRMEGEWLTARLPSGRKLWYCHPALCRKEMPWSTTEQPDVRASWCYHAKKAGQWKRIDAYGGLMTENVVQALARDLLVAAMFKCEKEGLPVVLTSHDEIVAEPLKTKTDAVTVLEQIMTDRPRWAVEMQIPVAAECWEGDRYRK